jgi:hypothetical protein
MSAAIFTIEAGQVAFALVDTEAVGYLDTWQHPTGAAVAAAVIADYEAEAATWSCQVTSGMLTPTASTTTVDVPATFCDPARTIPQPGETSYALDVEFLQDPHIATGLSEYLFTNDVLEAYFLLGLNGDAAPKAIGRVRLSAGAFGGPARANLTASLSLPLSRKPEIAWGVAAPV